MSYNPDTADAIRALGLNPERRLPDEGTGFVRFNNIQIRIMPKAEAQPRGIVQRTRGVCPRCGREFALGNLNQHLHGPIGRGRKYYGCGIPTKA